MEGVVRAKLLAVSQEGLVAASDALLHLDDATLGHSHHPEAHLRHYDDLLALENTHATSDSSTLPFGYKVGKHISMAFLSTRSLVRLLLIELGQVELKLLK